MKKSFPAKKQPRGFVQTGALITAGVRKVAEKRGFAETRLLTTWVEVVGSELAALATPLKVSYSKEGFGATLTLSCQSARAPELSMQLPVIKDRVNACYGYNAISRIRISQGKPAGFHEAAAPFRAKQPAPAIAAKAEEDVADVGDAELRTALSKLGANVMSRPENLLRQDKGN